MKSGSPMEFRLVSRNSLTQRHGLRNEYCVVLGIGSRGPGVNGCSAIYGARSLDDGGPHHFLSDVGDQIVTFVRLPSSPTRPANPTACFPFVKEQQERILRNPEQLTLTNGHSVAC